MKMKLKKIIVLFLLAGFSIAVFAQKPTWTDYYKRIDMYPENEFLVGYISGVNTTDKDPGELKSIYESLAKDKVIQSIQVEIETNNDLVISNTNGKSSEEFLSKSVSFSKADVAGLTTQSYYDRRKKEVFAIAFVNKKELAFYYRNIIKSGLEDIEQKLIQGRNYVKKGNKELALKSFYEAMPFLMNIDQARTLLIAMNRKMYADINMDEINKLTLDLNNEIVTLLNPKELNLSETAYFIAYGLFLQLGEIDSKIFLEGFTFENTGLVSNFSTKLNQEFAAALVESGKYKVIPGSGKVYNIVVTGNFWKEGEYIKIAASAYQNEKLLAVSKGSLPISWLNNESVDYVPEQIHLMNALTDCRLNIVDAPKSIKTGMPSKAPMNIKFVSASHGISSDEGIPIETINAETEGILCSDKTNESGISTCFLPSVSTNSHVFKAIISINLAEYLNVDRNSLYYAMAVLQNPVNKVEIDFTVEKPTIFIKSKELLRGSPMNIKTLEPVVKETLAENYNFVNNPAEADYIISIDANTTTGTRYQGIYFAYLDANLSVVTTSDNEEIFKTHLDQIKGGGSNTGKAGKKAYLIGSGKLKELLQQSFLME